MPDGDWIFPDCARQKKGTRKTEQERRGQHAGAAATAPVCGDGGIDGVCEQDAVDAFCSQEGLGGEEGEGVCLGEGGDEDRGGLGGAAGGGRVEGFDDRWETGGGEGGEEDGGGLGRGGEGGGEGETGTEILYETKENDTPKSIAKLLDVDYKVLMEVNNWRWPLFKLLGTSKFKKGTMLTIPLRRIATPRTLNQNSTEAKASEEEEDEEAAPDGSEPEEPFGDDPDCEEGEPEVRFGYDPTVRMTHGPSTGLSCKRQG